MPQLCLSAGLEQVEQGKCLSGETLSIKNSNFAE